MADFTSGGWSIFITVITVVSLIALAILCWALSARTGAGSVETSGHVWDEDLEEYNNPLPRWWLNMFYITIAWGFLYLIAYPGLGTFKGMLGWSQEGQYESEIAAAEAKYAPVFAKFAGMDLAQVAQDPEAQKIGGRLFAAYCTTCHGSDGGGARGFPNLRDGDWLWGGDAVAVKTTILNGRQAAMPAWGAIIGADGVQQVTAYVEKLAGRATDEAAAAKGAQVYQTNCVACHGAEGKGNPMMGAPNLTDDVWLYGGSTVRIAESIDKGRNGIMPAQAEVLGEEKVHLLAAYVLSLGGGAQPAP
jgi:cytochrome c oxidase cbb3-type subunit 3